MKALTIFVITLVMLSQARRGYVGRNLQAGNELSIDESMGMDDGPRGPRGPPGGGNPFAGMFGGNGGQDQNPFEDMIGNLFGGQDGQNGQGQEQLGQMLGGLFGAQNGQNGQGGNPFGGLFGAQDGQGGNPMAGLFNGNGDQNGNPFGDMLGNMFGGQGAGDQSFNYKVKAKQNPLANMFSNKNPEAAPYGMEEMNNFQGFMGNQAGNTANIMGTLQGLMKFGNSQDNNFLGMATQLYTLYQMNPNLVGNAMKGFISNWNSSR